MSEEIAVEPVQPPCNPRFAKGRLYLSWAIFALLGAIAGALATDNFELAAVGAVSVGGLGIAFMLNWFVIAPRAGRIADEKFSSRLRNPSEDDQAMFQNMTEHLVVNIASIADNDEACIEIRNHEGKLQKVHILAPLFHRFQTMMNEGWNKTLYNIASQRKKGIGAFNPENYDMEGIGNDLKGMAIETISGIVDPMADAVGFSDEAKAKLHNVIQMRMMAGAGGNSPGAHSPQKRGYQPLGGR